MKTTVYNKLVRDKIPEIIESSNKRSVTEILSENDYQEMLDKKLIEEANEYFESRTVEELVDIYEILVAILVNLGISMETFQEKRLQKLQKSGGFSKKILLKEVIEE